MPSRLDDFDVYRDRLIFLQLFTDAVLFQVDDSTLDELPRLLPQVVGTSGQDPRPLLFDPRHFYILVTGLPKRVFTGMLGIHRGEYSQYFFSRMAPILESFFARHALAGIGFLQITNSERERRFVALFSPEKGELPPISAFEELNEALNRAYQAHLCPPGSDYPNGIALSGALHCLDDAAQAYAQTRQLADFGFFRCQPLVMTLPWLEGQLKPFPIGEMQALMRQFEDELIGGHEGAAMACLDTLFLEKLKNSFSFSQCQDVLGWLKQDHYQCCLKCQTPIEPGLDQVYQVQSYYSIEQCHRAVAEKLSWLCRMQDEALRASAQVSRSAVYYIRTHYQDENLSLEHIAGALFVSPAHLSRVFNRDMGLTIREYVAQVRVAQAKRLLTDTQMGVGKISLAVGLPAAVHFTRLFKRLTGATPTQYRQQTQRQKFHDAL